jgi:hypothetical protein
MEDQSPDIALPKHKKLRKVLLILLPFLVLASIILIFLLRIDLGGILLFLIMLDTIILVWISRKYYNWIWVCLMMIVMAIIFRSQRWPLTSVWFTIGFSGLACISFFSSALFLKKYNHNIFLKYIGFSSSIILTIVSLGLLWKNMHWALANVILNAGLVVFIPFLFAFIFTLPGSNYISWSKSDRIIFFRIVIIPMAFVYTLCVMMFVLPDLWTSLTRTPLIPFQMWDFGLLNKPGLY